MLCKVRTVLVNEAKVVLLILNLQSEMIIKKQSLIVDQKAMKTSTIYT